MKTIIRDIKFGLVPNGYSGYDNRPLYNSVDSSLLLFEQIMKYLKYTNDDKFIKEEIYNVLPNIIENYKKGIDIENTLNFTLGLQNLSEKDDAFLRLNSIELIIYYTLDLEIIDTLMSVEEKDDYYNIKIIYINCIGII